MIRATILRAVILSLAVTILFSACRKRDDVSLPDNLVVFTSTAQGITETESAIGLKIKLSRGVTAAVPVTVRMTPQGVTYGTDFTTTPAAANGQFVIEIPEGNNEATFTVNKIPGALFDGDEKITFDLYSSGAPILIGSTKELVLNFSELVANNSKYNVEGGGVTYPNKVFIDLSANRQTSVLRTNWDLGFYSGSGAEDWRVILNPTVGMMAKAVNKTDLSQVTALDTVGFSLDVSYSQFDPQPTQMAYVDLPNGDLTGTAIGPVSATAPDNKVYIVNRGVGVGNPGPNRGWKKIRVLRNASGGYTLQHADIAATTFSSIEIPKDAAYFFKYLNFETGIVPVEPEKTKWDLAWTYTGFATNFGFGDAPYMFQDIIIQNRNVQVAKVMTDTKSYEAFAAADIAGQSFSSSQVAIGSDWRAGGGPSMSPAARKDRYYIIKDGNNNYYKVKFNSLTKAGERGYPEIEYALVKRG
jgi:hypothetical protein